MKESNLPKIKIDPVLKAFCGNVDVLPTHEVIKRLWKHIRDNKLKLPKETKY